MSTTKAGKYHHGDLRRGLLEAARELLRETGPDGLTLREVARRAGVSHAAPYHHFSERMALLEALVVDCFSQFVCTLQAEEATGARRVVELGVRYVRFAVERAAEFRLMFRPELLARPAVAEAARQAYAVLVGAIAQGQHTGELETGDPEELALGCWAQVHGLAMLRLDGLVGCPEQPIDPLVRTLCRRLVRGLLH